ncbi:MULTISPECIES: hypothetical protein [Nocardioides]|uniref:Heparin-binding hemagglutinin n=1 Tax=Nocardioides vastitatis TaxID=2568655 RepID=A0ABW0ZB15_9ACTN|nr:hypothetical protein [Nocardioides sp.]
MAKFDVKLKSVELPELPPVVAKPLYAGVGATDLAVQKVITYVTDVQAKVTANVADLQKDVTSKVAEVQKTVKSFELPEPKALQGKATQVFAERRKEAESRLAEIQTEAKSLPTTVKVKYDQNLTLVSSTYAGLAKHGETVVSRIRKGETAAPVEVTKKVAARKAPAKKAPAATAKKAPAKKAPAKKAPAKKAASDSTTTENAPATS